MTKVNCWDYMKCGKGPYDGKNNISAGCPVARHSQANGLNKGSNGGRICWLIADKHCSETLLCSKTQHSTSCNACNFHKLVKSEEGLLNICRSVGDLAYRLDKGN